MRLPRTMSAMRRPATLPPLTASGCNGESGKPHPPKQRNVFLPGTPVPIIVPGNPSRGRRGRRNCCPLRGNNSVRSWAIGKSTSNQMAREELPAKGQYRRFKRKVKQRAHHRSGAELLPIVGRNLGIIM